MIPRTVAVAPGQAPPPFEPAGVSDVLDYTFDFTPSLPPLDAIAACAASADSGLTQGTVTQAAATVKLRLGPATTGPGTYGVYVSFVSAQGRVLAASSAVTLS